MTGDSIDRKIGSIEHEFDYGTFNWKISNVTSIPQEVDYAVQSPPFTFGKASFILKMYPNGQTKYGTQGYIDVAIKRVDPASGEYRVLCTIYYKNIVTGQCFIKGGNYLFEPDWVEAKALRFMPSLKSSPTKWNVSNDVFSLTFIFGKRFTTIKESDISSDSLEPAAREKCTANEYVECQEIGKLFSDNLISKTLIWETTRFVLSFPLPSDYYIQSPEFVFGRATWIMEIHFLKKDSKKVNINMILKRLHSEIAQHNIVFRIKIHGKSLAAPFCFNALKREENAIIIPMKEELTDNVLTASKYLFDIDIRMEKNVVNELDSSMKLESSEGTNRENPESSPSTNKGEESTPRSSTALRTNEVIFYVILGILIGFFVSLYNGSKKK